MASYTVKFDANPKLATISFHSDGVAQAMSQAKDLSGQQTVSLWSEGRRVCIMYPPAKAGGNWMVSLVG